MCYVQILHKKNSTSTCWEDFRCHADKGIWNHALHGNRDVELPRYVPVHAGLYALQLVAYVTGGRAQDIKK